LIQIGSYENLPIRLVGKPLQHSNGHNAHGVWQRIGKGGFKTSEINMLFYDSIMKYLILPFILENAFSPSYRVYAAYARRLLDSDTLPDKPLALAFDGADVPALMKYIHVRNSAYRILPSIIPQPIVPWDYILGGLYLAPGRWVQE